MSDIPCFDFHIHTHYLGCGNSTMQVSAIVKECARLGVAKLAITDHLNTLDQLSLHLPIKEDIQALDAEIDIVFGAELNFTECDGDFAFSPEIKEEYGFQFAIGGIHGTYMDTYNLKEMIDIQHRHHIKTCLDPLVDVLVHPYWFGKGYFDKNNWPWFDSMQAVPKEYARELGQAAKDTGTAIEINGGANLKNPNYSETYVKEYIEYLSVIAEGGAAFAFGSDAHDISRLADIKAVWETAEQLSLSPDRIWKPE